MILSQLHWQATLRCHFLYHHLNANAVSHNSNEVAASVWDAFYERGDTAWQSPGVSGITQSQAKRFTTRGSVLEVGCGSGKDTSGWITAGYQYIGIDIGGVPIERARTNPDNAKAQFIQADFFDWHPPEPFDVVYEKGVFHGLSGVRRRSTFARRVSAALKPLGIWLSVVGSADGMNENENRGALFLRDVITPVEVYFEVLEIVKAPYQTTSALQFDAWYLALRKRG
jgi:2-polyprenyl-3-methyl-5-hydroxy-6-metoxy-1,4-benzoquinol methylase